MVPGVPCTGNQLIPMQSCLQSLHVLCKDIPVWFTANPTVHGITAAVCCHKSHNIRGVLHPALHCCVLALSVQVKLLMVGSARRLRAGVPLLAQLLDWVEGQGRVMQLPADALAG